MLLVAYLAVCGQSENLLHQKLVEVFPWILAALIGAYIGAPVWDDFLQSRGIQRVEPLDQE